jgi:hypothetical protein
MAVKMQALSESSAARPEVITRKTGRALGQAFPASPPSERRRFPLEHIRDTLRTTPDGWRIRCVVVHPWSESGGKWHNTVTIVREMLRNTKIPVIVGDDQGQGVWLFGCNENR